MFIEDDTIVSQITPRGTSAVGIIRVSGIKTKSIILKVLKREIKPRYVYHLDFFGEKNVILDSGVAIWFLGPSSFTGEDVLELQGHGNQIILNSIVQRILSIKGVRIAEPGEFSKRAFLNGKIDLIQAEAISDLISSNSQYAIQASLNSLKGIFSKYLQKVLKLILELCVHIETEINFSEEENIIFDSKIDSKLKDISLNFLKFDKFSLKNNFDREGIRVVIAGHPNAGKSSLFNLLTLRDRSIVTNIKGTTRDVVYENILIKGTNIKLVDTAGIHNTRNKIEKIGIKKAWEEIKLAEHIFFVIDASLEIKKQKKYFKNFISFFSKSTKNISIILNKIDLVKNEQNFFAFKNFKILKISVKKEIGIESIWKIFKENIFFNENIENKFLARSRHLDALEKANKQLLLGIKNWKRKKNIELLAEDLKLIQNTLNKITGNVTSDDVLKKIFSDFCIGK
ncbi:tRNA uridine-5-carboxymethylaminomethyl(34) synthesis GTPase MnmE [Buchnera aphidicola (Mindarus keteleerifoliae)]|uniref:tRNA uridine-5-carboxymethylaminomethyl(34) synthesis GTPase MnmE n=1 Tax=Buchnera aphidicola TaxID=9 RepID=UPI0031B68756